ncbi:histidine kinase [Arthrobacter sp. I2-34]|uniref:histidine kinase n=1 Tax=Arthrobacter hankyongi TaxID=2904801 RepID=A0ABS9L716_9MICC|nr:histidine kinase [Arthrobacter hankyongi]MCG2622470.1 histidine kinase [Arthrobacter hankyongi]
MQQERGTGQPGELPHQPGPIRRFLTRHPVAFDVAITALCMALTAIPVLLLFPHIFQQPATAGALAASSGLPLLVRRRYPVGVLVATAVLTVLGYAVHGLFLLLPLSFALYAVAVYRSVRVAWAGFACVLPILVADALINDPSATPFSPDPDPPAESGATVPAGISVLIAVLIGTIVSRQRRHIEALAEHARQLAVERDQRAKLAAALERTRIAREMHDIIAHSLSVMVALADGSDAVLHKSPERAGTAIREVAKTGRKAMADLQGVLGVLKEPRGPAPDGPEDILPPSGPDSLLALVETFRVAGLPLTFTTSGTPPEDPALQMVVHRIVQEALTNTLRYARSATRVTAAVSYGPARIEVTVRDNGQQPVGQPSQGSRLGILGLQERTAIYGGTLEAGPHSAGGWSVRATIPMTSQGESMQAGAGSTA